MISINWLTKVITISQADLTPTGGSVFQLDIEVFRNALKDIEDSEVGVVFPQTHRRNAPVLLSGVTYAQTLEIINGYTVTFQSTGSPYVVVCVGANHNLADVKNLNDVSLVVGNSAGLIAAPTGGSSPADMWAHIVEGGLTAEQALRIILSPLAGKATGIGTGTENYLSQDGAKPRVTATFDQSGNRTSVTVDGT